MTTDELLEHSKKVLERIRKLESVSKHDPGIGSAKGVKSQVCEFLRNYAGPKNSFYKEATKVKLDYGSDNNQIRQISFIMTSFIEYVEAGLHAEISPERKAQLDVVSDFLEQANILLSNKDVHPASPAVLIGATLEEFLRTWIESIPLSLGSRKPSLQSYAEILREEELIEKQDVKDITSWAGIRNHAAHGEWEEVSDRKRVELMIEGVNLFMRKYNK